MSKLMTIAAVTTVATSACGQDDAPDYLPAGRLVTIGVNTVGRLSEQVGLGVSNLHRATYLDANGAEVYGRTALLTVVPYYAPETPMPDPIRVHTGQRLELLGHNLFVVRIDPPTSGPPSITLDIVRPTHDVPPE